MNKNDYALLNELSKSRNLSSKTKQGYLNAINSYVKFNGESFKDLLIEAELEEENGVRWKNRKLKQRLISFRGFLHERYLVSTAKLYFQRILTLYRHFEIEIHQLPRMSDKSGNIPKPITFEDLPTKEIIRNACRIANPVMRCMILFMSSSGCARRETLNLTVNDFIIATSEYHNETNVEKALAILENCENIVPIFRIRRQKTNKFYFTFCSPEASTAIVRYLLSFDVINSNFPLFDVNL